MGLEDLSDPWSGFHSFYSIGRQSPLTDIRGPGGEINKKTAYIQARSSVARALEINGERHAKLKEKQKWV